MKILAQEEDYPHIKYQVVCGSVNPILCHLYRYIVAAISVRYTYELASRRSCIPVCLVKTDC